MAFNQFSENQPPFALVVMEMPSLRSLLVLTLLPGSLCAQGVEAPTLMQTLDMAANVEPPQALSHLKSVWQRWHKTPLPADERADVGRRWISLLEKNVRSPEDVWSVVGTLKERPIQRQVLYHRYVEQHAIEGSIPFLLEIERSKGKEAQVRRILMLPR